MVTLLSLPGRSSTSLPSLEVVRRKNHWIETLLFPGLVREQMKAATEEPLMDCAVKFAGSVLKLGTAEWN